MITPPLAPLAALLLAAAPVDPAVGALVEKVIEAYGGKAALEKFPVMVQEGEVTAHQASDVGRVLRIHLLVPFREENFVQGRHSGTTEIRSVELLVEAPTGVFRP